MKLTEFKLDRERLLKLREEDSDLLATIREAVAKSKRDGDMFHYWYSTERNIDIINPHTGKPAKVSVSWLKDYGSKEQMEPIFKHYFDMERAICAKERKRHAKIQDEIIALHDKYRELFEGIIYGENPRWDGENDFADLLLVAQRVLEMCRST